jgi:pyridoxamine 5'-phosphate oxidase
MMECLAILRESLAREWDDSSPVAALATVDWQKHPHVRHVIVRRVDSDGVIWITSDLRSQKNNQIRQNRRVELCFWLPTAKEQFRIAAAASIIAGPERERNWFWANIPDQTRAMFLWPTPGEPLESKLYFPSSTEIVTNTPPETFELLQLTPDQIEHLELTPHPHRRRRWSRSTNWSVEPLNP